jgi:predicted O-linked N-acetylglucosamine transferase (SPINDLY family)
MSLNYLDVPFEELARAHRGFAACVRHAPAPPEADRDPERPLRVGVLTRDLRTHAVGFFADPILRHPPAGWSVTVFDTGIFRPEDAMEAGFRKMAAGWVQVGSLDDAALDAAIRARRIDVLVDLAAHTSGGRLPALDRKPAPVIATAIGYPNTTGHPCVDVRFVDSVTDPPGSDSLCTERLLRIDPCFLSYRPPADAPEPSIPEDGSPITFGSFNLLSKVSAGTLNAWHETLDPARGCSSSRSRWRTRPRGPTCSSGRMRQASRPAASRSSRSRRGSRSTWHSTAGCTRRSTRSRTTAPPPRARRCGWACRW